jgi:hypothetical protein
MVDPVVQHFLTLRRHDRFGVKLNAANIKLLMGKRHDDAVG